MAGAAPVLAAAPAVAGIAAAFCMSPQALASTPAAGGSASSSSVTIGHYQPAPQLAELTAAQVTQRKTASKKVASQASTTTSYTVQSGDTLSAIAARFYNESAAWPVLYWANKGQLQSADLIIPGQKLQVPAKPATIPAAPAESAPAVSTTTSQTEPSSSPAQSTSGTESSSGTVSTSGYGSFQACVIERESEGNSQIMNSSGHYGLYQFSAATWAAYGGNPADFGDASVAEQNQVFANAMAAGGESNWAPYDGC
jgi:LysM repeat protein